MVNFAKMPSVSAMFAQLGLFACLLVPPAAADESGWKIIESNPSEVVLAGKFGEGEELEFRCIPNQNKVQFVRRSSFLESEPASVSTIMLMPSEKVFNLNSIVSGQGGNAYKFEYILDRTEPFFLSLATAETLFFLEGGGGGGVGVAVEPALVVRFLSRCPLGT